MLSLIEQRLLIFFYKKSFKFKEQTVIKDRRNYNHVVKKLKEKNLMIAWARKLPQDKYKYYYYELTNKGNELAKALKEIESFK